MGEKVYTCDKCHKQFTEEEAQAKVLIYDPQKDFTLCAECAEHLMRKNVEHMQEQDIEVPTNQQGIPLDPASAIRDNVAMRHAEQNKLSHMRDVISHTTPAKIKAHLDEYIIGQEDAKRTLSVAVYNHYKRVMYQDALKVWRREGKKIPASLPSEMKKSNILLLGQTGSGKTAILKALANYLDVPFAITDASSLTEAGYVGMDPETCVKNLLTAAGGDVERAEHGIIFLDEFDKLARKSGTNRSTTSDPGHEGVQQALLKIIEGTVANINMKTHRRNPDMPGIDVNTENILFVCGGAFEGIEDIIDDRISEGNGFGFGKEDAIGLDETDNEADRYNKLIDHVKTDDVKDYGILPEMLGRLPIICTLHQLKEDDLVHILTQPKDAIVKQFRKLFDIDGCDLHFDDDALREIAKKAIETKTGARSLRTILEGLLLDTMYDLPDLSANAREKGERPVVSVTKDSVETKNFEIEYKAAA